MPNWVKNRLTFVGDQNKIEEIKKLVRTETTNEQGKVDVNVFDFNSIVPMPEDLNIESGSSGDWGMRYITLSAKHPISWSEDDRSFMERMNKNKEENPDQFNKCVELGKKYMMNIVKYGYKDWYDWACSDIGWSTKWNSCYAEWSDDSVFFDTAWSFPYNVVIQLSKKYPDVAIHFCFADEDCSSNTGSGIIQNEQEIDCEYPDSGSKEGYENYIEMWGEDENLVYNPEIDNYEWVDNE